MKSLIKRFYSQQQEVNQESMNHIINMLCQEIEPEKVFMMIAQLAEDEPNLTFQWQLIETLTYGLAASDNYKVLRLKLLGKKQTKWAKNKEELFITLWKSWCYNPVSALILCLLTRNYELAYNLVLRFINI